MNIKSLKKGCCIALAVYIVLALAFYWIGGNQLHYRDVETDMLSAGAPIGEITKDTVITQQIEVEGGQLTGLTLIGATYARQNTGTLKVEVLDGETVLAEQSVDIAAMADSSEFDIAFDPIVSISSDKAELKITAPESVEGNAVTLYMGDSMSTARNQVEVSLSDEEHAYMNGVMQDGALCVQVHSRENLWFGAYYWYIALAGLFAVALYCLYLVAGMQRGKRLLVNVTKTGLIYTLPLSDEAACFARF